MLTLIMLGVAPNSSPCRLKKLVTWAAYAVVAQALYWIAVVWRRALLRTTFVAVTGTQGKTTATELLATVLGAWRPTFRTRGDENTGLPLTLAVLGVRPWHRFAVIEIGVAAPGQMRRLARLVHPDVALVLAVLRTHVNAFGDRHRHAAEKAILLEELRPGGVAVLNGEDPLVARMAPARGSVVLVGASPGFDVWADGISARWPERLELDVHTRGGESCHVRTRLVGTHWASAVSAVVAAAGSLGVPLGQAAAAIVSVEPVLARMQPMLLPCGAVMLRDEFDGSIDTFEAGMRVLAEARAERRIVVISDVSDSEITTPGERLAHLGREIARVAQVAVFVGEGAEHGKRGTLAGGIAPQNVHAVANVREAGNLLQGMLRRGDLVFLAGALPSSLERVFLAQLGPIGCWEDNCWKLVMCDVCSELGINRSNATRATIVPPEWAVR